MNFGGVSPNRTRLAITGMSTICAVGHELYQSCASIRAGIGGFVEHPYYCVQTTDPDWDEPEPLIAGLVPDVDPQIDGIERLYALVGPVLQDLMSSYQVLRQQLARCALLLSLPEKDETVADWDLDAVFAQQLCARFGLPAFKATLVDQSAHTGFFRAIGQGAKLLEENADLDCCLVVGVDSYHHRRRLRLLDDQYRLRSSRNKDGFIPGEGAAALLLERANTRERPVLASITAPIFANEPRYYRSNFSSSAVGLQAVLSRFVGPRGLAPSASWVLCDLNGESYRAWEWGVIRTRMGSCFARGTELIHPADCIGDVGAATGGLLIAYVLQAFNRGFSPADDALCWTSSDDGLRAAVQLSHPSTRN